MKESPVVVMDKHGSCSPSKLCSNVPVLMDFSYCTSHLLDKHSAKDLFPCYRNIRHLLLFTEISGFMLNTNSVVSVETNYFAKP